MAWINKPYLSTDTLMTQTENGPSLFSSGAFYVQYGRTSVVPTTNNVTTNLADPLFAVQLPAQGGTAYTAPQNTSTLTLNNSALITSNSMGLGTLTIGTTIHVQVFGLFAAATVNAGFQLTLISNATGVSTIILPAQSVTGTVTTNGDTEFEAYFQVQGVGTAGKVYSRGITQVATSVTAQAVANNTPTIKTIDTTQDYTLVVQIVNSSSAAQFTLYSILVELVG